MLRKILASFAIPALVVGTMLWSTATVDARSGGGRSGGGRSVSSGSWSRGGNYSRGGRGYYGGRDNFYLGLGYGGWGLGYPYYGGYYGDYYPGYSYYPDYSDQGTYYYGAAPAAPSTDPNAVYVDVSVPTSDAQLFINGQPTTRMGTEPQFVSPPVTPGREYTYDIQAQWTQNGQPVKQTKEISVHAGEHLQVNFQPTQY